MSDEKSAEFYRAGWEESNIMLNRVLGALGRLAAWPDGKTASDEARAADHMRGFAQGVLKALPDALSITPSRGELARPRWCVCASPKPHREGDVSFCLVCRGDLYQHAVINVPASAPPTGAPRTLTCPHGRTHGAFCTGCPGGTAQLYADEDDGPATGAPAKEKP
jgi:hypothetical protein